MWYRSKAHSRIGVRCTNVGLQVEIVLPKPPHTNSLCCHFEHLSHLNQSPCKKCLTWCCSLLSACYQHLYISMLRYAYSMAGEPTIVPKNGRNIKLGQASSLSQVDKLKINRLYQCGSYRKKHLTEYISELLYKLVNNLNTASFCLFLQP